MDEQTALLFALQLVALFSIAGALLLYLLCKIRAGPDHQGDEFPPGGGKPVLVTSSSTALGLQVTLRTHYWSLGTLTIMATNQRLPRGLVVNSDWSLGTLLRNSVPGNQLEGTAARF